VSTAVNLVEENIVSAKASSPVVIVGTGPVGIKALLSLLEKNPHENIVIYGDEPWEPYNRVKLSSFLAGEIDWSDLTGSQRIPDLENLAQHHNCKVTSIDRENKIVVDETGREQPFSKLILALGSRPHIPDIQGTDLPGVYTFRNMSDAQYLMARQVKSRTAVVVGGGVLGLEVAKAMSRNNTRVIVVDHSMHLMSNQLDESAAELLREHIFSLGISLYLGAGIKTVIGEDKVTGVELRNGKNLSCDTVIFSTGIKPNIELARDARLVVGRGIRVSDNMQTSDPDIYAIGECAEHRDIVYGLVAPGFEQAKVAVADIHKRKIKYTGSVAATQLKVVGLPVFSMGRTGEGESKSMFVGHVFNKPENGIYRKIVIFRNRLVGAISVGKWDTLHRVQESISKERFVWPWQIKQFLQTGDLWPLEEGKIISQWPSHAIVCNCMSVTRGQCSKAINAGNTTIDSLMQATSASTICGGCRPLLHELLGSGAKAEKIKAVKSFLSYSLLAVIAAFAIFFVPGLVYNASSETALQWDVVWRNSLIKQISGFTILSFIVLALLVSLRKRWKRFSFLDYSIWRYLHVFLGVLIVIGLFVHTGFRGGNNLNAWLMFLFTGLILAGGVYGVFMSVQHKVDGALAQRVRGYMNWVHLLLFWPVPVLLGFHILKSYYF